MPARVMLVSVETSTSSENVIFSATVLSFGTFSTAPYTIHTPHYIHLMIFSISLSNVTLVTNIIIIFYYFLPLNLPHNRVRVWMIATDGDGNIT